MPWDEDLTGPHYDIAADDNNLVHVLAGPGTGKTYAMMRRIARFLERGADPERVLAVSFTRTAVRDLHEQLTSLRVDGADRVRATTLHSFAFRFLAEEEVFQDTGRVPRMLLDHEEDQLVNDLMEDFGGKRNVRRLLKAYLAGWARLQWEEAGPPADSEDARFEVALLEWLRYHRAMLVGELVPLTLRYVRQNPAVEVIPRFDHVLVDEYQDLNKADQTLVHELAASGTFTVIGDDNQSIYRFLRHANREGIAQFPSNFPGASSYTIDGCHRCPPNLVAISNSLIQNNAGRAREVALVSVTDGPPAQVHIVQHHSVEEEAELLADYVDTYLTARPDMPPGQVLVLTPRRIFGEVIKRSLIERGRNALSYFEDDPIRSRSAAEGFCLLTVLVSREDRIAQRAWIGFGRDDGMPKPYARVREYAVGHELEPSDVLDQLAEGSLSLPYCNPLAERHHLLLTRLGELEEKQGLELIDALWPADDESCADIRLMAQNIAAAEAPLPPSTLREELVRQITQPILPGNDSDIIRVMSLHKSKGLTAELVVIAGCVAGALPSVDERLPEPEQDEQREEQRRLFYVAITRPQSALVISSPATIEGLVARQNGIETRGYVAWGVARIGPSPFIDELGACAPDPVNSDEFREMVGISG